MELLSLPFRDPVLVFLVVLGILLVAPFATKLFKLPPIVGLIILGVAVGPRAFGILENGNAIELLGTIGALFIMFLAGLDVNMGRLRRSGSQSAAFASLSFILPFAAGFCIARLGIGMGLLQSLLFGALLSTHTLVSYPAVSREGVTRNRAVTSTVGATLIVDSAAMVILTVIAAATEENLDFAFWLRVIGSMAAYLACAVLILPRIVAVVFRHLPSDGYVEYVFVLAVLFVCAFGAKLAGFVEIVGAFVAGLAVSRLIPEKSILMNRIQFTGNALFIPFFLVSIGMRIDVRIFGMGYMPWVVSLSMAAAVVLTKLAAAKISQGMFRFSKVEGDLMFGLSVNKATAALAIALVGFTQLKLFDETVFSATIFTIAVSCIAGAIVTERSAKRLAAEERPGDVERIEHRQRIMVPVANFETAKSLIDLAFLIRGKESQEPIFPLSVVQDSETVEKDVARAEKLLAPVVVRGVGAGVPVSPVTRVAVNTAEGITHAVRDQRITTLLLGWNGSPTIEQRLFGGVLEQVILDTQQLVIVCRLSRPVHSTSHLALVLPPLTERHAGFRDGLENLLPVCQSLALRTTLVGDPVAVESAHAYLAANATQSFPLEKYPVENWKEIFGELKKLSVPNGAVALFSARPGRLGWQPSVDKLPRRIATELEDRTMLVLYLTDEKRASGAELSAIAQPILAKAASKGFIRLDLDGKDIEEGIGVLLGLLFPAGSDEHASLSERFSGIAQRDAVELGAGISLLHAHVDEAAESSILIGVNHKGFAIPGGSPAKLVFILAPAGQPPEDHLKVLADIARLVQDEKSVDALLKSRSISELVHSLSQGSK